MSHTLIITVVGGHTSIGAETARLAVAIGYDVFSVTPSGDPPSDEPWIHGVKWSSPGVDLPLADAVIVFDAELIPIGVLSADTETRHVAVDLDLQNAGEVVTLDTTGVEISRAAMATLRCAVEEERQGSYTPEEVAYIGDAMMIQ